MVRVCTTALQPRRVARMLGRGGVGRGCRGLKVEATELGFSQVNREVPEDVETGEYHHRTAL